MGYTTKRLTGSQIEFRHIDYIGQAGVRLSEMYPNDYEWWRVDVVDLANKGYFAVCERDGEIVGFMIASFYSSTFDPTTTILQQNLLYATPRTRAAHYLLKAFIDFGRKDFNHIITMIAPRTNIKPQSLKRLGFKELETLYGMET